MNRIGWIAALIVVASCSAPPRPAPPTVQTRPVVAGYLAGWGVRSKGTNIAALPGELTHVIYAFARVGDDGRAALGDPCLDAGICRDSTTSRETPGGNFAALAELKRRQPHLGFLVAFGGWSGSQRFSDVAVSDSTRRAFVSSALDLVIRRWPGLFDGIDIDWEYPVAGGLPENARRPEDRRNFTLLMAELRRQLDAQSSRDGRRYWLTAATSAGATGIGNLELDSLARIVDWLNVMTYDYHGGQTMAHFNAPLYAASNDPTPRYNVDSTIAMYRRAGMPANKLVIGIPFYSRSYGNVPPVNDGLFQTAGSTAPREWTGAPTDVKNLTRAKLDSAGFVVRVHPEAQAPWAYNATTGVWITFEDSASMARKADYVRERRLGGVMIWELGGDDGRFVRLLAQRLRGAP
jgi:chitinase